MPPNPQVNKSTITRILNSSIDGAETELGANDIWKQNLAERWNTLQECLGTGDDHQAIELTINSLVLQLEEVEALAPGNRKPSLLALQELADLLGPQFEYTGQLQFIDLVIRCQYRAVAFISDNDPDRGGWMNNLASSYLSRFTRSEDPEDLNAAIAYQLKALQHTPQRHENIPVIMCNLGNSHNVRFRSTLDRADIDKSIDFYTQGGDIMPEGHDLRLAQLESLGQSYLARFDHFEELSDIEKAIELQSHALGLVSPSDPRTPGWLHNLAKSYNRRFDHLGNMGDINKAVELLSRAVGLIPESHRNMSAWLHSLGTAYRSRFAREGKVDDINQAIEYYTNAVSSTPDGHPHKDTRLGDLGSSYRARFGHLGELGDLENAIQILSHALALEPIGSEDVNILMDLGNSYGLKFEHAGQLSDVDEAISYLTRAEVLATDQPAATPNILTSLSTTYFRRFERLENLNDINKAIDYQTQAVSLLSVRHINRGLLLNNLGELHARRYEHSGRDQDIDIALQSLTQAISLIPKNHVGRPGVLHNLAHLHYIRRDSTPEDTNIAIEYQTEAVLLTPEGHSQLANFTNSLGFLYRRRFRERGKLEDIDQAIRWMSRSVGHTSEDHARMPLWLRGLAESYLDRYRNQKDLVSLCGAIECHRRCAENATVSPDIQLQSAISWAQLVSVSELPLSDEYDPLKAYQTAMSLVPHVIWLGSNIGKRYQDASKLKNLASRAATWAIAAQKYGLALEWLEEGRSVVWSQMLQLRNPLDDLAGVDSLLAANLRQVAAELFNASSGFETNTTLKSQDEATQKHHRLAEKYQELVEIARKLPGFNDFLRPAKISTLTRAAQAGPLIVINVDDSRCDALVIRPGTEEIVHIPLPNLSLDIISSLRMELEASLRMNHVRERGIVIKFRSKGKHEDKFEHVLSALWTCITKPVLGVLGYKPKTEDLPLITWCTTGALSFLPLHASGQYDQPLAKLSDYAISSYTPTMSALLSAISSSPNVHCGVLAVGQESTPGKSPLPGTKIELANIRKHVPDSLVYSQLDGYRATSQAVLSAMEHHDWVHLACHAHQNTQVPTKSGFFLHGDTLSLEQIARVSFHNKGLAFLSACQTATGDKELPDEAIHLAAGMLMAGYSSVIATLWSIVDEDAPLIADEVYACLLEGSRTDAGSAAKSLHQAVGQLRKKVGDKAFSRWIPYIHMGGYEISKGQ